MSRLIKGSGLTALWSCRRSCTGRPSAHCRDRPMMRTCSWPAVVMRPSLGPVRCSKVLSPLVVE